MKIKYDKFGTKNIICNNWGEFFSEFKSWHAKNKGIVPPEHYNEEKFDLYVGYDGEGYGDFWERDKEGRLHAGFSRETFLNNGEVYSVETVLGAYHKAGSPVNELAVLVLNLKVKYNDWKKQEEKAGKVLREIWTTGAAKSTHGLDLNWPKKSRLTNNPPEEENTPIKDKNQHEKYENWTKEQLINEIKQLKLEIEELKNDKVLSICSKQSELKKKQSKLEKMEKHFNSKTLDNSINETNSNNTDYLPYMLGGIAVLVIGVVIGLLLRNRVKKSKLKH